MREELHMTVNEAVALCFKCHQEPHMRCEQQSYPTSHKPPHPDTSYICESGISQQGGFLHTRFMKRIRMWMKTHDRAESLAWEFWKFPFKSICFPPNNAWAMETDLDCQRLHLCSFLFYSKETEMSVRTHILPLAWNSTLKIRTRLNCIPSSLKKSTNESI